MANSNKKTPKNKHTIADYIKVYKKRFAKLDKKTLEKPAAKKTTAAKKPTVKSKAKTK